MTYDAFSPLLDIPRFPAPRFSALADRLAHLLGTSSDVLILQAEAVLALEAVALGLARPGQTALNIVTSYYGNWFGEWLRRGGATVIDVVAEPGQPIMLEAVETTLAAIPQLDILAVVHGEGANGVLNPLPQIARLAKTKNALVVVDAVASVGAHRVAVDEDGLDVTIIGPQKALGGPVGLSAVSISPAAWRFFSAPGALTTSALSIQDLKEGWLDKGRQTPPGTPVDLEFWALEAALNRVEAEGQQALIARHGLATSAARNGIRALGVTPWIADDEAASALLTAAPIPAGIDPEQLIALARQLDPSISPGVADVSELLVRINHTGPRAQFSAVLASVTAYGHALAALGHPVSVGAAAAAIAATYAAAASE
jgi:aspartate aminotransferase-like enzyme